MIRLVHLSIALYVNCRHARMRCGKTDELIVIWFGGGEIRVGPRNYILDGVQIPSHGKRHFWGVAMLPFAKLLWTFVGVVRRCKGDFEGARCQEKRNALSDSKKRRRSARRRRHQHGHYRYRLRRVHVRYAWSTVYQSINQSVMYF